MLLKFILNMKNMISQAAVSHSPLSLTLFPQSFPTFCASWCSLCMCEWELLSLLSFHWAHVHSLLLNKPLLSKQQNLSGAGYNLLQGLGDCKREVLLKPIALLTFQLWFEQLWSALGFFLKTTQVSSIPRFLTFSLLPWYPRAG